MRTSEHLKFYLALMLIPIFYGVICLYKYTHEVYKKKPEISKVVRLVDSFKKNPYCKDRGHILARGFTLKEVYHKIKVVDSVDITYRQIDRFQRSIDTLSCERCQQDIIKDTSFIERSIVWSKCFKEETITVQPFGDYDGTWGYSRLQLSDYYLPKYKVKIFIKCK